MLSLQDVAAPEDRAGDLECLCPRWKPLMRLTMQLANEGYSFPENEPSPVPGCSVLKNQPNDFKMLRQ